MDKHRTRIPEPRKRGEGIPRPDDKSAEADTDESRKPREPDVNGNVLPGADENNFDEDVRR